LVGFIFLSLHPLLFYFLLLLHTFGVPAGCVHYILFLLILVFSFYNSITMQRALSSRTSALTRAPFSKLRTSGVSVQQQRFAHKVRLYSSEVLRR
jgi:hypothetical protein